jgi:hypothetical protein
MDLVHAFLQAGFGAIDAHVLFHRVHHFAAQPDMDSVPSVRR